MVPYHFFILDKIPLSPNGKVDRKALPGPETELAGEYIAPQDELEKKLVRIWAELLHVEEEKIGIVHDFFQLGGHSLSLIQLVSKIYREFDVEVSVTQIFNNPIIKNISKIIKENILAVDTPFVLLNRRETEKKIFCFPPQVGYGIMYQTIASIAEDYSWYSFNFIEDIDPEERIKIYMDCITDIQPKGPYIFFGYSAAGTLTFQAAKALENHGHQVSDIIFFDCGFSKTKSPEPSEEYKKLIEQATDNLLNGIGADFLRERVLLKTYKYMEYYGNIDNLEKINANVHLVISEEFQNHIKKDRELDPRCWEEFTTKDCFYYIGSGQHQKMFVDGPKEKNSKLLRDILNSIESGRYPQEKKTQPFR
jgi:thioesterase domain-containing protein/acyl carrier protein